MNTLQQARQPITNTEENRRRKFILEQCLTMVLETSQMIKAVGSLMESKPNLEQASDALTNKIKNGKHLVQQKTSAYKHKYDELSRLGVSEVIANENTLIHIERLADLREEIINLKTAVMAYEEQLNINQQIAQNIKSKVV